MEYTTICRRGKASSERGMYRGKVAGSSNSIYDVAIDIKHPRRSTCNCPFADGRRVICKHMVSMYLGIFPEKEAEMMEYIEEQNLEYERELEREKQEKRNEITKYVKSLTKAELQKILINRMIDEMEESYERHYW